jgi:hypothetical protein
VLPRLMWGTKRTAGNVGYNGVQRGTRGQSGGAKGLQRAPYLQRLAVLRPADVAASDIADHFRKAIRPLGPARKREPHLKTEMNRRECKRA